MFFHVVGAHLRKFLLFCSLILGPTVSAVFAKRSDTLRVISFNTWLISVKPFYFAEDLEARLTLIPHFLKQIQADVILLQEVWGQDYRERLIEEFRVAGLTEFAYSKDKGNGLLTVSKYPMGKVETMVFSTDTGFLEQFEQKGVLKTQIDVPQLGWIEVYNTHLGSASYDDRTQAFDFSHLKRQEQQIEDIQQFFHESSESKDFIIGGDFNFHFDTWVMGQYQPAPSELYEKILGNWDFRLKLHDAARKFFRKSRELPYTYSHENPYVRFGGLYFGPSSTFDYLFYSRLKTRLNPIHAQRIFDGPLNPNLKTQFNLDSLPKRLSDHFGLLVDFEIKD